VGHALQDGTNRAGRMRIGGRYTRNAPQNVALLARGVAWVERQPVGQLFDIIAVQVDLEFVHSFRMIAGRRDFARNGVTDVDHKNGSDFATEKVEVRDVEADILPSNGRVEVMGHGCFLVVSGDGHASFFQSGLYLERTGDSQAEIIENRFSNVLLPGYH
jgi:hypothetical protein